MIQLSQLSFAWHDSLPIFNKLDLRLTAQRIGLVGPNACGKSTLLALIAGHLQPESGSVRIDGPIYFLPQLTEGPAPDAGKVSSGTWQKERLREAFQHSDHLLLLDEPSNHLDASGRRYLLDALARHRGACIVASHDRVLLEAMDQIIELQPEGPRVYGGGYSFFKAQRDQEQESYQAAWQQKQQELSKAKRTAQRTREKAEKRQHQGVRVIEKGGIPRIAAGVRRMRGEQTAARLQGQHAEKIADLSRDLREKAQRLIEPMELHFDVKGQRRAGDRPILSLSGVQHRFDGPDLWSEPLHLMLKAGEHLALLGDNGTGKSTLLKIIMNQLRPTAGHVERRFREAFFLDQDLSALPLEKSLLQIWDDPLYNPDQGLRRTIAARLGLKAREASVPLRELSGGQRLRAALVLLATRAVPVDLILLDEPSNHLDLDALDCLVATLQALPASLIVVTHDPLFLQDLGITHQLTLQAAR